MSTFASRCGQDLPSRAHAVRHVLQQLSEQGIQQVRVSWCDLHGHLRSKTLMPGAVAAALSDGIGMVSTLALKDTADRTAYAVFEPGAMADLPGFGMANSLMLLPDPGSFQRLPWAPQTARMQAQAYFASGAPVALDSQHVLQAALLRLAAAGYGLKCGLEVEFHIFKIDNAHMDLASAAWPAEPPRLSLVHPGHRLLSEDWADMAHEPLAIVQHTAEGLGLPLTSLEIEFGPSQFEAVFSATDAFTAADHMLRFRNGVRQALRRAGYLATFMCKPPFDNMVASGWHVHQSLVSLSSGANVFRRDAAAPGAMRSDINHVMSDVGEHWLAGLLEHAGAVAALSVPTVNGYSRFQGSVMAPQVASWGRDNRGASFRVLGEPGDEATRIENRLGEPMANPYLCLAAQVHAGLDGLTRQLRAPPANASPYADGGSKLPASLGQALDVLTADSAFALGLAPEFMASYAHIKRGEQTRYDAAPDKLEWLRREYLSRF